MASMASKWADMPPFHLLRCCYDSRGVFHITLDQSKAESGQRVPRLRLQTISVGNLLFGNTEAF